MGGLAILLFGFGLVLAALELVSIAFNIAALRTSTPGKWSQSGSVSVGLGLLGLLFPYMMWTVDPRQKFESLVIFVFLPTLWQLIVIGVGASVLKARETQGQRSSEKD